MAMFMNLEETTPSEICRKKPAVVKSDDNVWNKNGFKEKNIQRLARYFLVKENEEINGTVPTNYQRMRTFLQYVEDSSFQINMDEDIETSQTIWSVCCLIVSKGEEWIHFPNGKEELNNAKAAWQAKSNCMPNVIGAIDCIHIPIIWVDNCSNEFVNTKGNASINVQATCDANGGFTSVDCSWPGSVPDSKIWLNSKIRSRMLENKNEALLIRDDSYEIEPALMIPFHQPETQSQLLYNKIHAKEHGIIGRTFEQLLKRYSILQSKIKIPIKHTPTLIVACFILYNIALLLKEVNCTRFLEAEDNIDVNISENVARCNNIKARGEQQRAIIATYLSGSKAQLLRLQSVDICYKQP